MADSFHRLFGRALALSLMLGSGSEGRAQTETGEESPAPGLDFHAIEFYAHARGGTAQTPAAEGEGAHGVEYQREFEHGSSSYIATQVVFKNLHSGGSISDYKLIVGLYTFAGQLIGARERTITVPPEWKYTWTSQSFGWPEAGRWDVGTYRAKVWLDGVKVGEAAFYVRDEKVVLEPAVGELEIESLEFYEGGEFFRPGLTSRPATEFSRSKARRIFWVVGARNRLHKARTHRPNIVGYFYRPDGTLLAEAANSMVVPPELGEARLFEGIGWPEAGNWEPGEYRFELEQDNRVVAERSFRVSDPLVKPRTRPLVIHYGLLDAGMYSGADSKLAGSRKYLPGFPAAELETLWAEIVVINNPKHETAHSHRVRWEWLSPEGQILTSSEGDFVIQPAWRTASHRHSHSVRGRAGEPAGRWEKGAYKVRVLIDGRLEKVLRFTIAGIGWPETGGAKGR